MPAPRASHQRNKRFGLLNSTTHSRIKSVFASTLLAGLASSFAGAGFAQAETSSVVALLKENPSSLNITVNGSVIEASQIIQLPYSDGDSSNAQWQATFFTPEGSSTEKLLLKLRQQTSVTSAELNHPAQLSLTPNDTVFSEDEARINHHQMIESELAWDQRTDCSDVVIAIVDTGVDEDHPDIEANLWTNPGEIADNGIDDDNNGYIDDIHGACVQNDCEDHAIEDGSGHGSHVAGLVAAVGNNQTGVTGVCWNAQLMIVKSLDDRGSGSASDVSAGINYAVDNGADIINTSLTISQFSSAIESAIQAAEDAEILVVAAAGNFGSDNDASPAYPANFRVNHDNVISIANVTDDSALFNNSNYGLNSVDMAAPGVSLYSTWSDAQYANSTGTSMAAPLVAATAASTLAEQTQSDKSLKAGLLASSTAASELNWQVIVPGILNANNALTQASNSRLSLFRAEAAEGNYQLHGYDLSNVDLIRYSEQLTTGEQITDFTEFSTQDADEISISLPNNSKSGTFTAYQGESASNSLYVRRTISAPNEVSAERDEDQLVLSWNNPLNADTLHIERAQPGTIFAEVATLTSPTSVFEDTIEEDSRYNYRIRGSYQYIDPQTSEVATEYSTYSRTLVSDPEDSASFSYWITETLPNVGLQTDLSLQLSASSSGSYSLASGQLPTGLSLSTSGLLFGTVSETGDFTFSIDFTANNSSREDNRIFSLTVTDAPAGTMQLTDQQSLVTQVSVSAGTLNSIQALTASQIESLDSLDVELVQQVHITGLPITSAESSEISISIANVSSGNLSEIYLANSSDQWLSSSDTSNSQLSNSSGSIVIEDGSEFDLDDQVNGEIIARIASASENNSNASASGGSDSRCFIASAVYPANHQDLHTLRAFRDNTLKGLPGGEWFIGQYYQHSPSLVAWMQNHPNLLAFSRSGLELFSKSLRHPLESSALLLVLLASIIVSRRYMRRQTCKSSSI